MLLYPQRHRDSWTIVSAVVLQRHRVADLRTASLRWLLPEERLLR